jgi:hypothetical protein
MKEQDCDMLRGCYDPKTPVIILDLGLVYGVTIVNDWVGVKITLMSVSIQNITSRIEFLAELLSAEADHLAKQIIFFRCREGIFDVTPKIFICLSNSGSKETRRILKKQRKRRKLCHTH